MRRLKDLFKGRAGHAFAAVLVALILLDSLLIYYNLGYTTDERETEAIETPAEILNLERSSVGYLTLATEDGAFLLGESGFERFNISGEPTDLATGYATGATAVSTEDEKLYYFKYGALEPLFTAQMDGDIDILGIAEKVSGSNYLVEQIVLLIDNETGSHLVVASASRSAAADWTFDFDWNITSYATSDLTRTFAFALENNSVYYFKRTDSAPRSIFQFSDNVKEVRLSPSGLNLAVLYGDSPSYVADFSINEPEPLWVAEVPGGSRELQMHREGDWLVVASGDDIVIADSSGSRTVVSRSEIDDYLIPTVADRIFISSAGEVLEYKAGRQAPVWKAEFDGAKSRLLTDAAGSLLVAWNGSAIAIFDLSQATLGSGSMWFLIGLLLICEGIGIPIFIWRKQIVRMKKTAFYVIVIGAIVGVAIASLTADPDPVGFFGGLSAYLALAGTISALAALVAWNSEGGIGSIVVGFATGLFVSIPAAWVATFLLWASGFDFGGADIVFGSALNGLVLGLKMGAIGGVAGYICDHPLN